MKLKKKKNQNQNVQNNIKHSYKNCHYTKVSLSANPQHRTEMNRTEKKTTTENNLLTCTCLKKKLPVCFLLSS